MDFFQFNTVTEVLNTQMLLKLLLNCELLGLDLMINDHDSWSVLGCFFFSICVSLYHQLCSWCPTSPKSIYWEAQQALNGERASERERETSQLVSGIQELQASTLRSTYNINGTEEAEMKSWLKLHWFNITPFHREWHCLIAISTGPTQI